MFLAIGTLLSMLISPSYARWDLNDVSYLYPIPSKSDAQDFLIAPDAHGKYGELIPSSLVQFITPLAGDIDDYVGVKLKDFRVISVRVDPCFKMVADEKECHPQIRMVWQPFRGLGTDEAKAHDAAIHTFYDLPEKEFKILTTELKELKAQNEAASVTTDGLPLDVHPAFLNVRTRATFASKLRTILLSHIGASRLVRATQISRPNISLWWQFSGFDFKGNAQANPTPVPMLIPRTRDFMQEFFNLTNDYDPNDLRGAFTPKLSRDNPDDLTRLIEHYDSFNKDVIGYYRPYIQLLEKMENPRFFDTNNLDCIHCHLPMLTAKWFKDNRADVWKATTYGPFRYANSDYNLENLSGAQTDVRSIRSFGYFENKTVISNRVINESADVAKQLNAMPPEK